jgi:hypothetical protein
MATSWFRWLPTPLLAFAESIKMLVIHTFCEIMVENLLSNIS